MRYYDGSPPDIMKFGTAWPNANFGLIDKTTEISPGITLIALVSDKPGTLELKELSLAVDTPEGVVLVVGCSHPGIDRIVAAATAVNKRIHLIAGGLHLATASDAEIEILVTALRGTYHVAWVAPGLPLDHSRHRLQAACWANRAPKVRRDRKKPRKARIRRLTRRPDVPIILTILVRTRRNP